MGRLCPPLYPCPCLLFRRIMDFKDLETKLKFSDPQDVKDTLEAVKRIKEDKHNKLCTTKDLSNMHMGNMPVELLRYMEKKYGKDVVNTKKFMREFFATFKVFSTVD